MGFEVRWSPEATEDIEAIAEYIETQCVDKNIKKPK